jgi:predicted flap endonuclease-1-like 5' DNA nuclease
MKKKIIMCIIASAMICGTFASCGKTESSDSKSESKVTTAITTATITTAADETETTTTTEAKEAEAATTTEASNAATEAAAATTAPSNDEDAANEHLTDATAILNALNDIDRIGGGGGSLETDSTDTKEVGTMVYEKVTDSRFTKLEDVKNYVTGNICGTLLDRYSFLYQGQQPFFKEFDGVLYFCRMPRGAGFAFNGEPVITDVTDNSFTITVSFDNYGGNSDLTVKAVKEDGKWKASSFSVDGGAENVM